MRTVSVIIPTLNEADWITATLESVAAAGADEIIVIDGGSTDDTVALASPHAEVLTSLRGRARQLNAGAARARGCVLLFLHADTRLRPASVDEIRKAMDGGADAGCFRLRFEPSSPALRIYGALTALPFNSICFGDRGLFTSRPVFESVGGFADIPLFEDLDIVRRISRSAAFVRLTGHLVTSSRRFDRGGAVRQQLVNSALWLGYMLGVHPSRLAHFYDYPAQPR